MRDEVLGRLLALNAERAREELLAGGRTALHCRPRQIVATIGATNLVGQTMHSVGIRELKNETSEIIRAVREEHAEYVVTHHGRPVAVILPIDDTERDQATGQILAAAREREDFWARMAALRAEIDAAWRSDRSAVELVAEQRR